MKKHRHARRARVIFCDMSIHGTVNSNDLVNLTIFLAAMQSKNETENL